MSRIVELRDKAPLIVRPADVEGSTLAICRCGLSAAWPYCDGSHAAARDEAEGEVSQYTRNEVRELVREKAGIAPGAADPRKGIPDPRKGGAASS